MKTKTVAIVGKAQATRGLAPYDDPDVDIWCLNVSYRHSRRISALFEMHPDWETTNRAGYTPEYKLWLQQPHEFPIYMHYEDARAPACVPFPIREIGDTLGRHIFRGSLEVQNFYTSSVPFALALAAYQNYTRVEMYGIEMYNDQYLPLRECVFFWWGKLSALGIDVIIPPASALFTDPIYPFQKGV